MKATRSSCSAQVSSNSCFSERSCVGSTSAGTWADTTSARFCPSTSPALRILLEEWLQVRPECIENRWLAPGVGVHAVLLHAGWIEGHLLQQERHERQMILVCQLGEHTRELLGVARPVVGRDAHADQQDPGAGGL